MQNIIKPKLIRADQWWFRLSRTDQLCPDCGVFNGSGTTCRSTSCLLCEAVVCMSYGLGRGQCPVCYHGYLQGWSTPASRGAKCGYTGCGLEVVATAPRVKLTCSKHYERAHRHAPELPDPKLWKAQAAQI